MREAFEHLRDQDLVLVLSTAKATWDFAWPIMTMTAILFIVSWGVG